MTAETALEPMAGLATPLWLLADDGTVPWCNRAGCHQLGLIDGADALASVRWRRLPPAAATSLMPGERQSGAVTFLIGATPDRSEPTTVRCHLSRIAPVADHGDAGLLAEAAAEDTLRGVLEEALDALPDGIALFDASQNVIVSNQRYRALCRDGGLAPERMVTRLAARPQGAPALDRQATDGRWLRLQAQRRADGGTLLICRDVSELRQCQARLSESEAAAQQDDRGHATLLHHVSHELRTPLTAVIGFSEIIADDLMPGGGGQRYRDYAAEIRDAASYMLDLINNILDLARVNAGQMDLNDEPCDLGRLIALTVRLVTTRARASGVAVTVDGAHPPPLIIADTMLVRQMLTNLITNAVKFASPVKGRVDITTSWAEDGGLAVVVTDTGIGMRADQIPQALHPFRQVHQPGTVADQGSGLGLALTKALIEHHGGRLAISSAPGVGTEIRLVFPPERIIADRPDQVTPSMIRTGSAVRRPF